MLLFEVHLVLLGSLAFRSGYLPTILGILAGARRVGLAGRWAERRLDPNADLISVTPVAGRFGWSGSWREARGSATRSHIAWADVSVSEPVMCLFGDTGAAGRAHERKVRRAPRGAIANLRG